jgi:ABC-2 type transport system ATP-binding protein
VILGAPPATRTASLGVPTTRQVAPSESGTAIAFEGVTKRYRSGALALEEVTWSVSVGSRACLLGPNGAGKSTAIRLLQGALGPTAGHVTLLGTDVDGHGYLEARRRTGIVPQGPGMYTDLTVAEYLDLARNLYGRGDVGGLIDRLALGPHRGTMLAQLSGGFQRRVVLAAALLLLDEPTVGLDPLAAHEVHALLAEVMAREGRTTLLCTHNLAEAETLCEEVVILRGGRVLVQAGLADLRARAQPRLRLAAHQGPAALLAALAARGLTGQAQDHGGVDVALANPEAAAPALLRTLLADGLDVYVCTPEQASLEDLFLDLVRGDGGAP